MPSLLKTSLFSYPARLRRAANNSAPSADSVTAASSREIYASVQDALDALQPDDPLRCLFPSIGAANARRFRSGFPFQVLYAVKSNPDPELLTVLLANGIYHFDVASLGEIKLIRSLAPDARLSFMHPVKNRRAIRAAYFDYGVREFVLDSADELYKIHEETGYASDLTLIVRIAMPKGSALCALTGKFGTPEDAPELLQQANKIAAKIGVSFHVGSQTLDPVSYINALVRTSDITRKAGIKLDVLDVGGGFPIPHLGEQPPELEVFFDAIKGQIAQMDLNPGCEIWAEPGRALSGTTEVLVSRVELRKGNRLYLNDGSYGNLFEICCMNWHNDVKLMRTSTAPAPSDQTAEFELFGPTCDSVDHLKGPFALPQDIKEGDWIAFYGMGAYGAATQTPFNGFGNTHKVSIIEE